MRSRPPQNRWIGQHIDDPHGDLIAMARAQGFDSEAPVTTANDLTDALERARRLLPRGAGTLSIHWCYRLRRQRAGSTRRGGEEKITC